MGLVRVDKSFRIDKKKIINFWELNPQMSFMSPYSILYNRDYTEDKDLSSREMWTIVFMLNPDEDENIFFRKGMKERLDMLKENFCRHFDETDEEIKLCMDAFENDCMDSVEKAFSEEKEELRKRANFIKETPISLDYTELVYDDSGNPSRGIIIKGTATQLEAMRKNTLAIYQQYEKVESMFNAKKAKLVARGGSKISKAERREI